MENGVNPRPRINGHGSILNEQAKRRIRQQWLDVTLKPCGQAINTQHCMSFV
jgi:hypothetical protein